MARDFTDYVLEILGSGERACHRHHIRQLPKDEPVSEYAYNNRNYLVLKDRAKHAPASYHPWRLWDKKQPFKSIREILRSKKIGVISYREPYGAPKPRYEDVIERVPVGYSCKICATAEGQKAAGTDAPFTTKHSRAMKSHVTRMHKGANHELVTDTEYETVVEKVEVMETVEPYHISRMHQPSGRLVGEAIEKAEQEPDKPVTLTNERTWPPLTETISPRVFKAIVDSPQLRRAYKSFKFGNIVPLNNKWWVWMIVVVVVIFVVLFATGNFSMG